MKGFLALLRDRLGVWTSPFTATVPEPVRARLITLQHDRLAKSLPLVCLVIAASAVAMAVAVMGDLPLWRQAAPPIIIIGVSLAILMWIRLRPRPTDIEAAWRGLRNALFVAIGLGAVAGAWCVSAFVETEKYYCMTAPVFIGIGALVTASSLLAVPRAAIAGMCAAVAPIVIKLSFFPYTGMRAMAAMMVLITLMQARMILRQFRETVTMMTAQHELDWLARSDVLTGLATRRAFMDALEQRFDSAVPVCVAMADLDGFKQINDCLGHSAGDTVLIEVAQRLRLAASEAETIARVGGDEFALIFNSKREAMRAVKAIRLAITRPITLNGVPLSVGISIGVAERPQDGNDIPALLHAADLEMYADKAINTARCVAPVQSYAA